jgi:hypothetical protein
MNSASTLTGCVWPFASTSREGLWRCGLVQRAVAVLLLGGILLLAPLAFASPIDAGWIAGLYDGADFDDVTALAKNIPALTSVNCVSDASPDWEVSHTLRVVGIPAPLRDVRLPLIFIVMSCSRAPPVGQREGFPRPLLPETVSRPFPVAAILSASFFCPAFVLASDLDTRARGRPWQVFTDQSMLKPCLFRPVMWPSMARRPAQPSEFRGFATLPAWPGVDARTLATVTIAA